MILYFSLYWAIKWLLLNFLTEHVFKPKHQLDLIQNLRCIFSKLFQFLLTTFLLIHYLSVSLACWRVGQAWGGVTRAGRRGGRQGGRSEGRSNEGPATGVSSQRGRRNWGSIQSHTAHTALDLFSPQLRVLLLLLNQSEPHRHYYLSNGRSQICKACEVLEGTPNEEMTNEYLWEIFC